MKITINHLLRLCWVMALTLWPFYISLQIGPDTLWFINYEKIETSFWLTYMIHVNFFMLVNFVFIKIVFGPIKFAKIIKYGFKKVIKFEEEKSQLIQELEQKHFV